MMNKKRVNRFTCNLILAGLLTGTLPATLPLHGQVPIHRGLLKIEIAQKVKQIKKTINRFKAARIAAPTLVIAAGVGLAAIAATVIALLFLIPRLKIKQVTKELSEQIK